MHRGEYSIAILVQRVIHSPVNVEGVEIICRDDHLIGLNKPSGLLSVPGVGPDKCDCLAARVQAVLPEARIVHRLDRDTSGVIVMALDPDTHRELSRQFQDREAIKRYIAIAAGQVAEPQGTIDLPIRKDLDDPPRQVVDFAKGKPSVTHWRVSMPPRASGRRAGDSGGERLPTTRLELRPVTGRSHQLRVHLKEIGHPILGDDLYAPPEVLAAADRLMLHAEYLMVVDPYTAEPREFVAACPF